MSTGTFSPINAGGLDTYSQSQANGWYQLPVPGAVLPVLAGITIPPGAQGFILNTSTGLTYCFSPSEVPGQALALAAGGWAEYPGRSWIDGFAVELTGGTTFTIQWIRGSIGPLPSI